jgi:hypothetical protein
MNLIWIWVDVWFRPEYSLLCHNSKVSQLRWCIISFLFAFMHSCCCIMCQWLCVCTLTHFGMFNPNMATFVDSQVLHCISSVPFHLSPACLFHSSCSFTPILSVPPHYLTLHCRLQFLIPHLSFCCPVPPLKRSRYLKSSVSLSVRS